MLVSGELACFPRPGFHDSLVTYDVLTPIAALGLIETIHWRPAIRWNITAMHLLTAPRWVDLTTGRGPVRALVAPRWAVDFDFTMTARAGPRDSMEAHESMFLRRARRFEGAQGYLGLKEFPATLELTPPGEPLDVPEGCAAELDLGWLPFERVASDPHRFRYFRACAVEGTVTLPQGRKGVFS